MVKYEIEGQIDFYEELYKSLDDEEEKPEDNLCLISNSPLTNYHISLECGHKFNYEALYNDLLNHKKKYNNMERCILKTNEIRCPYCRKVQKSVLPYYEELGLEKIHGVNHIDELKQLNESVGNSNKWEFGVCCFEIFDSTKNMKIPCTNKQVVLVEPTGKKYCYHHKYIAQKQYIAQKKMELKEKQKDEKLKKRMAEKLEKELVKENLKKQKLEDKMKNKKYKIHAISDENVIISSTNSLFQCSQILKTGANAGKQCECKVFQDNLCKRHYGLLNKTKNNENSIILEK
jgi:hypothetical protein